MSSSDDGPPKKKRGRYKQYLIDPTIPVPRTTIFSREKSKGLASSSAGSREAETANELLEDGDQRVQNDASFEISESDYSDNGAVAAEAFEPNLLQGARGEGAVAEAIQSTGQVFEEIDRNQEVDYEENNANQMHSTTSSDNVEQDGGEVRKSKTSKKSYVEKHHLNELLHEGLPLTRFDVLLMILHLAIRHCNTRHFIEDQIKFINTIFGGNALDVSYFVFNSLFKSNFKFSKHYFCVEDEYYLGSEESFSKAQCPTCKLIINDKREDGLIQCEGCDFLGPRDENLTRIKFAECPECKKQIDVFSVNSKNYFVILPLREQLEELLSKPELKLVSRTDRPSTHDISDVFDGEIYRKLSQPGYPLANKNALTVVVNTDGVAVHKSTKNTLWPIQLYVNEIVPEQRFKRENLILGGLYFGDSSPNMSLYLKVFLDLIYDLSVNGVIYKKPGDVEVKAPVYLLTCSVDSVAKPKLLCKKQFNAKMGCLYCYHPNDSMIGDNRNQRYYDQNVNYNLRCEEDVLRDMLEADGLQRAGELGSGSVNGFLGISILTTLSKLTDILPCNPFNMVWGVVIDYMHATLEGVTSDLLNIYENILSADQVKILDARIQGITPPQGMTRRPRSFSLRSYWKAKEFRAVILFYALPCLNGLLPNRDFTVLKHFVIVLHTLLSDTISPNLLTKATSSLAAFTTGYQQLYGLENVTYNLHICRHLIDMVIQQGPLWCYSNFLFESGNGYLVNLVRGTKSVVNEIANKHTSIQTVRTLISEISVTPNALSFCSDVIKCKYAPRSAEFEDVLTTGSESWCC